MVTAMKVANSREQCINVRTFKISAILLGILATLMFVAPVASATIIDHPDKVWVCKYVGTPGVDERLQTGTNPIVVSVNAIQHNQWDGTLPGWFSDKQDRSYVLDYQTKENTGKGNQYTGDLTCPTPAPTIVTPQSPDVTPPTCTADGTLVIPDGPTGVTYLVDPKYNGPGEYTITAVADKGYVLAEADHDWSWDLTVLPKLPVEQCQTPPPPVVPGPPNPQALISTVCGHATFTVSNLTPQTTDQSATFVTTINGKDSTQVVVKAGDTQDLGYAPTPNTGMYTIGVKSGGAVLATAQLQSNCGAGGGTPTKPPTAVENVTVAPAAAELPHTGGGNALPIALAGLVLVLMGAPFVWLASRHSRG